MQSHRIGNTAVSVTDVSMGCASIGNLGAAISDEMAREVLEAAWEGGIRYFDTAPRYGSGRSEQRLGEFFATRARDQFTVSTKVGRVLTPGAARAEAHGFIDPLPNDVHYDYSAEGFRRSLEGSRERLGVDYIDIVYVHDIGVYTHGEADNRRHMQPLMGDGLAYLAELKAQGRIGAYGLGVNESAICVEIMQSHPLDVILLAGRWTLLDRQAEADLVPLCARTGTRLVLGGIFNSGILAVGPKPGAWYDYAPASEAILEQVRELERAFAATGTTLPHAALQFGKTRPNVVSILIGTGNPATLARNLEMLENPLPPAALALLG
ncbi:aldo/keto reductase [Devosia faecipullorum]|uniref:aldo/keto reductase n=1 Tax=Devosia faecipullorum TaxID=2755039 RepID=UPI00187BA094|nr:aldo/keto reductase [Devosia faecipullorum]MBE7732722.1 aldo/keto reductase [Devosia faecipullorum]